MWLLLLWQLQPLLVVALLLAPALAPRVFPLAEISVSFCASLRTEYRRLRVIKRYYRAKRRPHNVDGNSEAMRKLWSTVAQSATVR
jgi:hypothetical protein